MKRIRIPGIVDIVSSDDGTEIEALAQDPNLDRAYGDHSIVTNGKILQRVQDTLQIGGRPFPTVSARCAEGRAAAQEGLWRRLTSLSAHYAEGPDELESLAGFVRGVGSDDACGPLVQQVVGQLFSPNFKATAESWNAALVLNQAPRSLNLPLLAWWKITGKIGKAKQLLSEMVAGDLAAVHAIGVALHNIVTGVNLMRQLYNAPSNRTVLSPEAAGGRCIFAPPSVLRQPLTANGSASGELETGTVVILNLQNANEKMPNSDLAFLRNTWSQCPAEQWVPALFEGIWRRACNAQFPSEPSAKPASNGN
ncbi:MAG TPA: hypothetical protein VGI45_01840 [Terracidiphilus sp.]|jgi:hypothetical protein